MSRLFLPRHSLTLAENQNSGNLCRMKKNLTTDSPLLFSQSSADFKLDCPNFNIEKHFINQRVEPVAGVDEVGRGPLAGPVVAASVILDPENLPQGLNDSKKLTAKRREELFFEIMATSTIAISSVPENLIDQINIRQASLLAMRQSVHGLAKKPQMLLVDGRDIPSGLQCHAQAFIKGDGRSLSIAAASIIAKVVRDRQMIFAASLFPEYGFENHKGYGTRAHLEAIAKYGPCPLHRQSFSPMNRLI